MTKIPEEKNVTNGFLAHWGQLELKKPKNQTLGKN